MSTLRTTAGLIGTLLTILCSANQIYTSNGSLTGNTGTQVFVQFDLGWSNSWRIAPDRWDAAWIFVKYRSSDGLWHHASLDNTGNIAPASSTITVGLLTPGSAYNTTTNPGVGAFIYRSAVGSGPFAANGVQLLWPYGASGISLIDVQEVRVFAIEMVSVPQGAFAAGSGGTETAAFTLTTINTTTATTAPIGVGSLGGQAGGYPTGQTSPANASWPNGFNAFYCMKYEVSQQGYVDFLNTLTYTQQAMRTATAPNSAAGTGALSSTNTNRNGIDIQLPGVANTTPALYACNLNGNYPYGETTDGTDIACNFLSWGDLTAYLDWSGLRPMTELEFEKACRGTFTPLANEYPWGTTSISSSAYAIAGQGSTTEDIFDGYSITGGNAMYSVTNGGLLGPLRVGIFADYFGTSDRMTAGAGYYGVMELGGSLYERSVTIGNVNGRAYTGIHGNGALSATGDPDVTTWPVAGTADGAGFRGSSWNDLATLIRVSDRTVAALINSTRINSYGGRGVRSAL